MRTVRMGIAGFGGRGGGVAHTALSVSGGLMQPVAAMDPNDDRFEAACAGRGYRPERYATVREMVTKAQVDVVLIGSPNAYHLENLRELEGLPVPIFLEKPLEAGWDAICDVVRFARSHPAPVMVGHCMRYAPILQKAKSLLETGAIGKVASARFVQYCHYGNAMFHNWRREMQYSGGMLIEKATHDLDVMLWLLAARPTSVFASAKLVAYGGDAPADLRCRNCDKQVTCPESTSNIMNRWVGKYAFEEIEHMDDLCVYSSAVDVPDDEIVMIQFDNGIHGIYSQTFYSPRSFHHRDYQISGLGGAMDIDVGAEFGGQIKLCERFGTTNDHFEYNYDYMLRNHYNGDPYMCQTMYRVVTGEIPPPTTVEQAFFAEALGYAANISAKEGRQVMIDEIIPDDLKGLWDVPLFQESVPSV